MSPHEDQLIAMGIERFTPFNEDYFSGSQKSMSLLICSMISQSILPHRTAKEIEARIKSKCLPTSPDNPIKVGIVLFIYFLFKQKFKAFEISEDGCIFISVLFLFWVLVLPGKPRGPICTPRYPAV
jgi:hypothetical protein